jgi:hypothetical protein
MAKYNIYTGKFVCHTCKAEVKTLRSYPSTKELTWMCPEKHISVVNLSTKKSKKDYEREERE